MAIVSRDVFEASGGLAEVGTRLAMDRYTSANRNLGVLAGGGRMFLVTVRPGERLWLLAILEDPRFDGIEWVAPSPCPHPIVDITPLRGRLVFKSGKGLAPGTSLGMSLQTPRQLASGDVELLLGAVAGAPAPAPVAPARISTREPPRHHFEVAPTSRSRCSECGLQIGRGATRVAELSSGGDPHKPAYRYHHVDCAITAVPLVVRSALAAPPTAPLDHADVRARVEAVLEAERAGRREQYAARSSPVAAAPVVERREQGALAELAAQLEDAPDDPAVLAVVADELQARGDKRGELIATQLALAAIQAPGAPIPTRPALAAIHARGAPAQTPIPTRPAPAAAPDAPGARRRPPHDDPDRSSDPSSTDPTAALVQRRSELMMELTPKLFPQDRCIWGTGYVRRLELAPKTAALLDEMSPLWTHPSLRYLREVHVQFFTSGDAASALASLATALPHTLRRLELGGDDSHTLGAASALVSALPRLDHLAVTGAIDFARLAHPGLAHLELRARGRDLRSHVRALVPAQLPALRHLSVVHTDCVDLEATDDLCAHLAAADWLRRLATLQLVGGRLGTRGIGALAEGLARRKLARLDVTGNPLPLLARDRLAALCDELVFPLAAAAAEDGAAFAEHRDKPEWGRGKIVRRFEGKLEVKFGKGIGTKVFKADAPFLRLS